MEQPKVGEEMRKMPVEPLLPVENVLLVILVFATRS